MAGAPFAALFFILVPFVRENFVLIAIAILLTNIGMALFRSPTIAYLGDLFKPEDHSKANGVINLMGGLGGMISGLIADFFIRDLAVLRIVLAIMGAFWALVNINSLPMVYDLGGGLIDLTAKNYSVLWLFSAVFLMLAAYLMLRVRPKVTEALQPAANTNN